MKTFYLLSLFMSYLTLWNPFGSYDYSTICINRPWYGHVKVDVIGRVEYVYSRIRGDVTVMNTPELLRQVQDCVGETFKYTEFPIIRSLNAVHIHRKHIDALRIRRYLAFRIVISFLCWNEIYSTLIIRELYGQLYVNINIADMA
jgi:hypothetical protein